MKKSQSSSKADKRLPRLTDANGFLVLNPPSSGKTIHFTIEDIKRIEEEMDREYVERMMSRSARNKSSSLKVTQ